MRQPKLYDQIADWWPVFSRPEDYAEEAGVYRRALVELAERDVREVLELGSGGGNNASHLKEHFEMTLVDLSPGMLEASRRINPGCEHIQGDMRSVRLGRTFDAVFVHDAVMYMTTEDDLQAVMETAYLHLRERGVAVFVPDETTENFEPGTDHGGNDIGDRSVRYLEWTRPIIGGTNSYPISFAILIKEGDGPVRMVHDEHVFGVFPRATWLRLLTACGFEAGSMWHSYGAEDQTASRELFWGVRRD